MTNNRKLVSVIIILLLASLACSLTGGNTSTDTVEIIAPSQQKTQEKTQEITQTPTVQVVKSACDNQYFPVKESATWSYDNSGLDSESLTRSILEVTSDGFTDQDVFSDSTTRSGNWECKDGDLISLDLNVNNLAAANAVAGGNEIDFEITSMEGVTLPAVVIEGTSWSQNIKLKGQQDFGGQAMSLKLDITNDCISSGDETITVPAGTFTAQRVECTAAVLITVNIFGMEIPTNAASSSTSWYAEGVGMIKTVSDNGDGTTSSLELASYNIP
ncbi:hypothetical protein ACFLXB_10185 [Chloroflexota bacterium]